MKLEIVSKIEPSAAKEPVLKLSLEPGYSSNVVRLSAQDDTGMKWSVLLFSEKDGKLVFERIGSVNSSVINTDTQGRIKEF